MRQISLAYVDDENLVKTQESLIDGSKEGSKLVS
jgi:hypothetical protein